MLFYAINVNTKEFILSHLQSTFRPLIWIYCQVLDILVINFYHWYSKLILYSFSFVGVDPFEYLIACYRNNALNKTNIYFVDTKSYHAVGLPWASLTISEEAAVISLPCVIENAFPNGVVDFLLIGVFACGIRFHVSGCNSLEFIERPKWVIKSKVFLSFSFKGL